MNVESYVCAKCGRHCKDKRGLSIHSRACQGTPSLVCEFCNTTFSSAYCLSIHIHRCSENKKQRQEQTESLKEELEKLREKLKTVELAQQEELKNCKTQLRNEYESQLKLRDDDLKKLNILNNELMEKEQESSQKIAELKADLNDTKVYLRRLEEINIELSLSERNTTIINDNRVQIFLCFDPSTTQEKIHAHSHTIENTSDLISLLHSLGVHNYLRDNNKFQDTLSLNKSIEGDTQKKFKDLFL